MGPRLRCRPRCLVLRDYYFFESGYLSLEGILTDYYFGRADFMGFAPGPAPASPQAFLGKF